MSIQKTDAEKGPVGAWAHRTRRSLCDEDGGILRPEVVAQSIPSRPHDATIRKIESDPAYNPRRMILELFDYYRELGERQGVIVEQPPLDVRSPATSAAISDAIVIAIERQTHALERQSAAIEALVAVLTAGKSK